LKQIASASFSIRIFGQLGYAVGMEHANREADFMPIADLSAEATHAVPATRSIPETISPQVQRASNVNYKEVTAGKGDVWQQKAEEHAESGKSFVVRPFNKQLHWFFLETLCKRFDLSARFDARQKAAYFEPLRMGEQPL